MRQQVQMKIHKMPESEHENSQANKNTSKFYLPCTARIPKIIWWKQMKQMGRKLYKSQTTNVKKTTKH